MANNDGRGYTLGDLSFSLLFNDNNAINNINELTKSLNALTTPLKKIQKINLDEISNKLGQIGRIDISNLSKAIAPLTSDSTTKKVKKTNNEVEKTAKNLKKVKDNSDKAGKSFKKTFTLGKLYFLLNYTKRIADGIVKMMNNAIDFNETLNKFQVSMGQYYDRALKYVDSLTRAFNLSTESIMNYQSTFMNMLNALGGLSGETSYELSETLTRMAIDYASLFNVSIERAMEQFQSVLSGQIRSIRTTSGYDVSEATIFSIYKQLGGTKTVRQLDQIEKRLLRILAVQMQMEETGAFGDFAGTINTASNTLKQLKETLKEIGMWIGQILLVYLEPFLTKLLSIAIAARELIKTFNILNGYRFEQVRDDANSLFGEVESSAEDAAEAIEQVKNVLLGFDKLNILGNQDQSNGIIPDYKLITDQLLKYSSSLDGVKNKATEIAEKILTWAGFTFDSEENIWKFNKSLDTTEEKISFIVNKLFELLQKGFTLVLDKINYILNEKLPNIIETYMELLSKVVKKLPELLKQVLPSISEMLINRIKETIASLPAILKEVFEDILPNVLTIVGIFLFKVIETIANIIPTLVKGILSGDFSGSFDFDGTEWENFANEMGDSFKETIENIKNVWSDMFEEVRVAFKGISGLFKETVVEWFDENIVEWFKETFGKVKEFFKGIPEWFNENVWKPIGNYFIGMINNAITAFEMGINFFIEKVNKLSAYSKLFAWAGIPEIPKIEEVSFKKIPALANGGIITKPTMAVMGEYNGASSNPEIATPESLMRKVFLESLLPLAQAIVSGDKEVVNAIDNLSNRPIQLNGRKVSESIYNDLQNEATRRGTTLAYSY